VIDTHVHHLDLQRFRYPWLGDAQFVALRSEYLPDDYRADVAESGVQGWIHVQAEVDHATDPVRETEWISELADRAHAGNVPGPVGCVVYADLRAPDLEDVLARHLRHPLTRGVRQEAWFDPGSDRADIPRENLLGDPRWRAGYARLAEFGLSFDLLVWPGQLAAARALAAEAPGVPVALEHLGLPDPGRDPGLRTWRSGVSALGELPHAYVKLSGFSALGGREPGRIRPVVSELIEVFGPERCMFGSNLPVERMAGRFGELYELVLATLADLSEPERGEVLAGTARRFYRL
jgi:predicted TIM-barrel fold metal-dependent hydrolase